jgi:hypothetical protein
VLLLAAILKGFGPVAGSPVDLASSVDRRLLTAALVVEFILGTLLLFGDRGRRTWYCALVAFALFAVIAVARAVSGADTCGCFGNIHISPWYTAVFDITAVGVLIAFPPPVPDTQNRRRPGRAVALGAAWTVALSYGIWSTARGSPGRTEQGGLEIVSGETIIDTRDWIGKPFPLRGSIDVGDRLGDGHWIVVLYRSDCDHCRRAVPRYEALATKRRQHPGLAAVALVEVPPYASTEGIARPGTGAVLGRLSADREWFVPTPVAIELLHGKVIAAAEGQNAERPPGLSDADAE